MSFKIVTKLFLLLTLGVSGIAKAGDIQATCVSASDENFTVELAIGDYPEGTSTVTMSLNLGDATEPEVMHAYGQYFVKEVFEGVSGTANVNFSLTGAKLSLYQDASGIAGSLFYKGELTQLNCETVW